MNNEVRPCLKSQLMILLLFKIVLVVAILLNSNGNLAQNLHATSFFYFIHNNMDNVYCIRGR